MRPGPEMSAGMMPALDWPGADQAGAVRADEPGRALVLGVVEELRGVLDRDALGDDDGERDAGVDGLDDGGLGEGGGTKMTETSAPVAPSPRRRCRRPAR
jgi:hypothetical protein